MPERVQMLIKHATFLDAERDGVVFSDPTLIGLPADKNWVELIPDATGAYPLDLTISARGPTQRAGAFRGFTGFQATINHKKVNGAVVTAARFRLWDGSSAMYWDGAGWSPASLDSHWNVENDVSANIAAFTTPRTNGGVWAVIVNLQTSDATVTPELVEVKFGINLRVHSWLDDVLFRSLVPDLKAKVRPVADFIFEMPADGNRIDIAAATAGFPFNVVDVETAFNRTDDPTLTTDLSLGYDPNTATLFLASTVASGKQVQIGLIYQPQIAVHATSQDFTEVEKVPALIIHNVELTDSSPLAQEDYVLDKGTNIAQVVPPPYRGTLSCQVDVLAGSAVDLLRGVEAVMEWVENNPILLSSAHGEGFRVILRDEFSNQSRPTANDMHSARARFEIVDVVLWKRAAQSGFGVQRVRFVQPVVPTIKVSTINPPLIDASDISGPDLISNTGQLWFTFQGTPPDSGTHTLYWELYSPNNFQAVWANGTISLVGDAAITFAVVDMFTAFQSRIYGIWEMHVWVDVFNPNVNNNETAIRRFNFHE